MIDKNLNCGPLDFFSLSSAMAKWFTYIYFTTESRKLGVVIEVWESNLD